MLSLAGATAYVWSWKIAIAVALVMTAVIASYRQTVHAYPSGGGDYEVATVNLGRTAGMTVASALLVDYVLTVAVSISSGAQYAAGAITALQDHEATVATVHGASADGDQPAWYPRVRHLLRGPDLHVHDRDPRHVLSTGSCGWPRVTCRRWTARGWDHPGRGHRRDGLADHARPALPAGPRLLVRLRGTHRCGGDLQRGAGLPAPQEQERRDHAAAPGSSRSR